MSRVPTAARPPGGLVAAMVSPLARDGRDLDAAAAGPYIRWLAERGVDGVFVGGTTGEGPLLSPVERHRLLEAVVAAAGPLGLAVVAHVGDITTAGACALAAHAARTGADAVAAVTPWFFALGEAELTDHFAAVAAAAERVPFFLYNIPGAARNRITPSLIAALAPRAPNLAGLKDSGGDLAGLRALAAAGHAACPLGFTVFCGGDAIALGALAAGADGVVSGNASTVPEPFAALLSAFRAGDAQAARRAQDRIDILRHALHDGLDLGLCKAVLAARGVAVGPPRPPLPSRSPAEAAAALLAMGPL